MKLILKNYQKDKSPVESESGSEELGEQETTVIKPFYRDRTISMLDKDQMQTAPRLQYKMFNNYN